MSILAATLLPFAAVSAGGPARPAADAACSVSLSPADAGERWQSAASAAEARLIRAVAADCRTVAVEVAADRAYVVFTTRDGRQAVRRIDSPAELAPLLDALLVTVPPAAAPVPSTVMSAAPVSSAPATGSAFAEHPTERPGGAGTHLVVDAHAGARLSAPGGFASPSFGARLGAVIDHWELSVWGQLDPSHSLVGVDAPEGFSMSRYAVGIAAGRQMPIGGLALALGMTSGVAVVSEQAYDPYAGTTGGPNAAEPLVGAYLGVAWPRRSALHLRSELSAEAVASRIGRTVSMDPPLPALPWWSTAASIGVEWQLP